MSESGLREEGKKTRDSIKTQNLVRLTAGYRDQSVPALAIVIEPTMTQVL